MPFIPTDRENFFRNPLVRIEPYCIRATDVFLYPYHQGFYCLKFFCTQRPPRGDYPIELLPDFRHGIARIHQESYERAATDWLLFFHVICFL